MLCRVGTNSLLIAIGALIATAMPIAKAIVKPSMLSIAALLAMLIETARATTRTIEMSIAVVATMSQ